MENSGVTVGAVVGSCVISFIIGLALTAVLCFCYLKRRKPSIPGSPHYISKQNSYVIVPLKEVRIVEEACSIARLWHGYFKEANSYRWTRSVSPVFQAAQTETVLYAARTIPMSMASAALSYIQRVSITSPPLWSVTVTASNTSVPISIRTNITERVICAESRISVVSLVICVLVFSSTWCLSCDLFVQWVAVTEHERELIPRIWQLHVNFVDRLSFRLTLKW